jgi:hypothetical protein
MSTKRELILANLETTLEGITTGNGYSVTVQDVSRTMVHWEKVAEFPVLYVVSGDERIKHHPGLQERAVWEVGIVGYVKSEDQKSQEVENLVGDVKKIVMVDTTRGGNAVACTVEAVRDINMVLSPYGIFEVELSIIYHYEVSSP